MLGTGILIKKKNVGLKTQIDGGKSTTAFRSGTPELAHIASIEKALEIYSEDIIYESHIGV